MPLPPSFRAIVFDMDGLLVNSEDAWKIAETALIAARGHTFTPDVRRQIVGLRIDQIAEKFRAVYQLSDSAETLAEELTARLLELIPSHVTPQPGAVEMLAYVSEQHIPRAIASSSSKVVIDAALRQQGWDSLFPIRCSAEDEQHGKPAPDVYLRAAERLGIAPQACLALEDSLTGAKAAVAAGMACYAVPDLTHTTAEAFDGITPYTFGSLLEVLKNLKPTP